jgi:hypothetical protein
MFKLIFLILLDNKGLVGMKILFRLILLTVTFGGMIVMKFDIRNNFICGSAGEVPYLPEIR